MNKYVLLACYLGGTYLMWGTFGLGIAMFTFAILAFLDKLS